MKNNVIHRRTNSIMEFPLHRKKNYESNAFTNCVISPNSMYRKGKGIFSRLTIASPKVSLS